MSEHTELLTSLHAEPGMHEREWQVINADARRICWVHARSENEASYLARAIVRACNSHEELLEACKAAKLLVEAVEASITLENDTYGALEAAIAKAEGRE